MRKLNKLSAQHAKNAVKGRYGDGGGCGNKADAHRGKWVLLVTVLCKRGKMGLGAYPATSLKEAREAAARWREVVREGKNPIKERERQRKAAKRNMHLLTEIALDAFESRKAELEDDGKDGR